MSSASSSNSRGPRKKHSLGIERRDTDQQMLTASDMADRKKTRRQLELKRTALEEAVERGICERIYPRLWRHSSTEDGERDAKLRSRAAALAIVGVDLRELLSTAMADDDGKGPDLSTAAKNEQDEARAQLAGARESLRSMNSARYPQGKLAALTAVHAKVVDFLSQMFPSTSSADEILPTLIYVIITSAPDTIHVVTNMLFIQRFRNANRLDGEAAYCLTNLEAAISFLETVDLSSIRRDELPEGPARVITSGEMNGSRPSTPREVPTFSGLPPTPDPSSSTNDNRTPTTSSPKQPRRLSSLISTKPTVTQPFTAASDVVFNTADTVHAALDNSFKYLFGRLREKQATASPTFSTASGVSGPEPPTPRTLADARKLVTEKADGVESEEVSLREALALPLVGPEVPPSAGPNSSPAANGKMLELISGRRTATANANSAIREASVSSTRSDSSAGSPRPTSTSTTATTPTTTRPNTRPPPVPLTALAPQPIPATGGSTASISNSVTTESVTPPTTTTTVPSSQSFGAVESMRKFGDSLNPLKGFSIRGFGGGGGRTLSGSNIVLPFNAAAAAAQPVGAKDHGDEPVSQESAKKDEQAQTQAQKDKQPDNVSHDEKVDLSGIAAPMQRFVDLKDARELNGYEVEVLLRDYQRLAGAVRVLRS